ncbi:rRNA maturation RNase YbeY [Haematobacter massiliensis]|uniref:rRNA maturation RNase YbeY n=1 Tax=Haematobacter massiliensis TaxID=195105 RepID=UPI00055779D8|nr:rRNA maturation RNase YbeY [Haematobacter massiliensis]OWJ73247.1 rRNA maturation RNase YbeY [Haematobacter massiliensis]OWJ85375.1 rRNA maturation RNase YbeY [Haematobacter massiliensis]QBJ23655.1 rRNA maturation RNase YbeY [Haematobacter massiliensis]
MALVDTIIEDDRWEEIDLPAIAEIAAERVLALLDMEGEGFLVSVLGCDDARIAVLNADFRGKPQPTNVLSWPSEERGAEEDGGTPDRPTPGDEDDPEELGDIAIAWETCGREASEQGIPLKDHVTHLVIHGILHLLGYDHVREADAALMEGLEVRILATMGISDPYA